jgi:hypothetical protein
MYIFRKIRRLWCWKYETEEECSSMTPGAQWNGGGEYFSVTCLYLIPFWIRSEEAIDAYIEKNIGKEWF